MCSRSCKPCCTSHWVTRSLCVHEAQLCSDHAGVLLACWKWPVVSLFHFEVHDVSKDSLFYCRTRVASKKVVYRSLNTPLNVRFSQPQNRPSGISAFFAVGSRINGPPISVVFSWLCYPFSNNSNVAIYPQLSNPISLM